MGFTDNIVFYPTFISATLDFTSLVVDDTNNTLIIDPVPNVSTEDPITITIKNGTYNSIQSV